MWNYAFISFLIFAISLLYHYYLRRPVSIIDYPNPHYDYIIVGAGTAGCVLATRLSEASNVTVLLIEAGEEFGWLSTVPILAPLLQGSETDWSYQTEPQQFSSKGFWNHKQKIPRGKGLGGSGQMNYLIHSFGRPEDYKNWPKGWSHADILPYFKKVSEIMNAVTVPEEEYLANAFTLAAESFKFDNATFQKGLYTVKKGSRWSTYHAYLMNAWNRENLHILSNTLVPKIFFKDSKAVGVKVMYKDNSIGRINAGKEVILSAGTINTPQLLLLSGVGPADDLEKLRIPTVRNLSGVGKNLFDHLCMPLYVNLQARVSITLVKLQTLYEVLNYFLLGKGWYATNGIMGIGRVNNSGIILFGMGSVEEKVFRDIGNYQPQIFRSLFPSFNDTRREGFIYLASCLQPKSRGDITLRSTNIRDAPKINPAYLEHEEDILCAHNAINFAIDSLNTSLFRKYGAAVHVPDFEQCRYFLQDYRDERFSECIIRTAGLTSYHPSGTCKMGTNSDAVVDENLRLAIMLRFLASGDSYTSLQYLFRVSKQLIGRIVPEVCEALIAELRENIKLPRNPAAWLSISDKFEELWNLPHCVGAIDGKHVVLQFPLHSGSDYYNYKSAFSIVLMAAVDAECRFIFVDAGCQGRISDGGVFRDTAMFRMIREDSLGLPPPPTELPARTMELSYFFAVDSAFSLMENIMKPYPGTHAIRSTKRIFNYRLTRARRVVENTFGIVSSVFRVLRKPLLLQPETAKKIVMAIVHLHNYLKEHSARKYPPRESIDREEDGCMIEGA